MKRIGVVMTLLVAALIGCNVDQSANKLATAAPTIESFTANPSTLPAGGGEVTLSWKTSGASSLWMDQGVGDVSGLTQKTVTLSSSTEFSLVATNTSGIITNSFAQINVAQRVEGKTQLRIANVSGSSSRNIIDVGYITEVSIDDFQLYKGSKLEPYGSKTNYIELPSKLGNFYITISHYDSLLQSESEKILIFGGFNLKLNAKYTLYLHRSSIDRSFSASAIEEPNVVDKSTVQIRFIDLYNKSDLKGSSVQLFEAGENCEYPSERKPISEIIPLKFKEPKIITNIKSGCYHFNYSSDSVSTDLKPANVKPGLNTIIIGGPEFDGGATVAVVSD